MVEFGGDTIVSGVLKRTCCTGYRSEVEPFEGVVGVTCWYALKRGGGLIIVLNLPARKDTIRSVERIIRALEGMYDSRISRDQQDSQEFLHLIHEALLEEDTQIRKRHPENEKLVIPPNPFEGELSTQIQCQRCKFTTQWKKEAFTELSVAVPSKVPPHVVPH